MWAKWSTSRPAWLPASADDISKEQDIHLLESEWTDSSHPTRPDSPTHAIAHKVFLRIRGVSWNDFQNLLPAWLRKAEQKRLHATSYLDGLRGVASFFVFIHHSSIALFPEIRPGYGSAPVGPDSNNHDYFIQLPILRLIYSGSAMVDIFFVISGAVLSLKPLRLAREGEDQKLIENLSSSVFRRGPRLFIPCFVSTFFTALASILGFMLQDGITRHYPLSVTHSWVEQFSVWFWSMVQFVRPNASGTEFEQNLWTIPMEFRGSLMVFLCALGVAKLRSKWVRTLSLVVLNLFWFYLGLWEAFLFLSGMIISEFSLYRSATPKHSFLVKGAHIVLVIMAAYLLSTPEKGEGLGDSAFGYGWIWHNFSPASWADSLEPGRFWPCFGAVLLVAVQTHAGPDSWFQQLFTTRFIQYLGEISFSFYLWHGVIIYTVGARVFTWMAATVGTEGIWWWIAFLVTEAAVLPVLFWISDLSTTYVDRAAVKFGKWLMDI